MALDPSRTVAELRELRELTGDENGAQRVCWTDTWARAKEWMADKLVGLRVFGDAEQKMNLAVGDVGGSMLVISQFTLYGDAQKGRRPSFIRAGPQELGASLYAAFCTAVEGHGVTVARGVFGAEMQVELVNDGPMTIWLDSEAA